MKKILAILTIFLLIPGAVSCTDGIPTEIVLSGTIEGESVRAGSRIGGRVAEVMVDEGDNVEAGSVLYKLETDVLEAERERAEAMVREAEAAYDVIASGAKPEDVARARQEAEAFRQGWELAKQGPLPEEIASLERQAASMEANWRNATDAADRMERLYNEGVAAEREFVAARETAAAAHESWQASLSGIDAARAHPRVEEVEAARARYYAASSMVSSLVSGATDEQLGQASARVDTANEALDRIDVDIAESVVEAPSGGLISTFDLLPGDFTAPGQPACEIIDMTKLKVVVYIPENRLGFIHEGDQLPLTVDSFPSEIFTGVVVNVAAEAEYTPRNVQVVEERIAQVFAVEITVDNPNLRLRPGMAADVVVSLTD